MLVPILFSCSFVFSSQSVVLSFFSPTSIPWGFVNMESQWREGIVAGTLETPPFTFPLFVSGSVFLNLTTVILQLVESEKYVFSGSRSEESILPSLIQFTLFRFAVLTPSRWVVIRVMQAFWSVSSPEEWRELPALPAAIKVSALWIMGLLGETGRR